MKKSLIFVILLFSITIQSFPQQASLTILNKSNRYLTTKVIKGTEKKGTLYNTVVVPPKGKQTIYFDEPGRFFTKNRAVLLSNDTTIKNDTLYNRSGFFVIVADKRRGYSNITMKFTVKKSKRRSLGALLPITRREFEED